MSQLRLPSLDTDADNSSGLSSTLASTSHIVPQYSVQQENDSSALDRSVTPGTQVDAVGDSGSDTQKLAPSTSATGTKRKGGKQSGACVHCKSLKVRCEYVHGESRCQRCIAGNHECVSRTRKKRKAAPTHEDLQQRSNEQDEQIQSLLNQLDQFRLDAKIKVWIARAQTALNVGGLIARPASPITCHYYSALIGPLEINTSPTGPDYDKLPILLRAGILEPWEVLDLFNLHFERINPFFSLLDGELHCPQRLVWSSHFLFTVICACASRHYSRRPGLYELLVDIARELAAEALVRGPKTVETVQAFLLLAVYPRPEKKWADNRSWLFMGAAIRIAQEIGLDKCPTEPSERENINRVRTWLNCYCVDASHAAQFGKMNMVKLDDHLVRNNVREWYKSLQSGPYDIGLCGYADMLLVLSKFRMTVGFSNELSQKFSEGFDVVSHSIQFDKYFADLSGYWQETLATDPNVCLCPVVRYRAHTFNLVTAYIRLVVLSVGFQYAVKKGITRESYILRQSIAMAETVIQIVIDHLFPSGFLSWAMEANFVYMGFSAAFLLNLLRPKFIPLLTASQCVTIVDRVHWLIKILGSDDVALDPQHSPAVYSKFLAGLLDKYYTPELQATFSIASTEPQILPQYRAERAQTPPHAYAWPDTPSNMGTPDAIADTGSALELQNSEPRMMHHVVRQVMGEADMDFSLSHFLQSARSSSSPDDHWGTLNDPVFIVPPEMLGGLHSCQVEAPGLDLSNIPGLYAFDGDPLENPSLPR